MYTPPRGVYLFFHLLSYYNLPMDNKGIGLIGLLGSGETSQTGGQVFEDLAKQLHEPLTISVMETPAGFESNAEFVAKRVTTFVSSRLQNFRPKVYQIAARKKGTQFSPDSQDLIEPLYQSNLLFLGPGSPSYTVRQLDGSLAWHVLQARHRLGASLVFASAAVIAMGSLSLPVYEIFKVGEDPHWKPGLNLLGPYGLALVFIPHWNNREGGGNLDTSRCFIGQERFEFLLTQLPGEQVVVGLDEHTALLFNLQTGFCRVTGMGSVHILKGSTRQNFSSGSEIPIYKFGNYHHLTALDEGIPPDVWQKALTVEEKSGSENFSKIPLNIQNLLQEREEARRNLDWQRADQLRNEIGRLGWEVSDTPTGPTVTIISS